MRGLVLAAGLGTRLRPITDRIPKPMLPVIGRPLVEHALGLLHSAGVHEVAVNTHHLAGAVEQFLRDGSVFGQKVTISRETPSILGTGGAIKKLEGFLATDGDFIVSNGDTMSHPDLPAAIEEHRRSGAIATMILKDDPRAAKFGAVEVDETGSVIDIAQLVGGRGCRRGLFIGTHVISSRLLDLLPREDVFCVIRQVYAPLLWKQPGAVRAVFSDAPFFDLGTPRSYRDAQLLLLTDPDLRAIFAHAFLGLESPAPGVYAASTVRIGEGARLVPPCALGENAEIGEGAVIGPRAVIGPGALVGPAASVTGSVVIAGARVPAGSNVRDVVFHQT